MDKNEKYAGMTVNERLHASGKFDVFDKAVEDKNTNLMQAILAAVGLDERSTEALINSLLKK